MNTYATRLREELAPVRSEIAGLRKRHRGSRQALLREMKSYLHGLDIASMTGGARLIVMALRRVIDLEDADGTIGRYENALRSLLADVGDALTLLAEDAAELDWEGYFERWYAKSVSAGDRNVRRTAFGHLMAILGLEVTRDYLLESRLPVAPVSVARAEHLVEAQRYNLASAHRPRRIRIKAACLLMLRERMPCRSDELRFLRWEDVSIGTPLIIVIARAAGAALKNDYAMREVVIEDPSPELIRWLQDLQARAGHDTRVFGSDFDAREMAMVDALVSEALKAATGDPDVNAMALRRFAINRAMVDVLHVDGQKAASAAHLHAGLLEVSASAGHASTFRAFSDYVVGLPELRYQWLNADGSPLQLRMNPVKRLQLVDGITEAAARKRVQRGRPIPRGLAAPARCPGERQRAGPPDGASAPPRGSEPVERQLRYVFERLNGASPAAAELAVAIAPASARRFDRFIELHRLDTPQGATTLTKPLRKALAELHETIAEPARAVGAAHGLRLPFRSPERGWMFRSHGEFYEWKPIWQALGRFGLDVRVTAATSREAGARERLEETCRDLGIARPQPQTVGRRTSTEWVQVDVRRYGWTMDIGQRIVATALVVALSSLLEAS